MKKYILALDQGTTSSRALLFDQNGHVVGIGQKEFRQIYPQKGWVEQDAMEIWSTQEEVMYIALESAHVSPNEVAAIGITNQRETTVAWDRRTGEPIYNAIVWQDKRSADLCTQLKEDGLEPEFTRKTGLLIDTYFSATKMKWILDNVAGAHELATEDNLCFGTVDSWLIWNLTQGSVHATDVSNASRTLLFDIHHLRYDHHLLELLGIPLNTLPEVLPSDARFGVAELDGGDIPICGVIGDQQSALFGQLCWDPGTIKNTYGTGCFMLMNTGKEAVQSENGLLTTVAWKRGDDLIYALEGSVFVAGAAIQWLRDQIGLFDDAEDTEAMAMGSDSEGVYFVPAFAGLGAPYWDMDAKGAFFGLTRDSDKESLVKATIESMAYQTNDVIQAMGADSNQEIQVLKVDGGASHNEYLLQFQADITGVRVVRPAQTETTAAGAAYMAGLSCGFWNEDNIRTFWTKDREFQSQVTHERKDRLINGWKQAVDCTRRWKVE